MERFAAQKRRPEGRLFVRTIGGLWNVVAHAGEDHVVGGLRSAVGCGGRAKGTTRQTGPRISCEIAVDALVLQAAVLGAVVQTISESNGSFENDPGCSEAVCRGSGI